MYEEEQSSPQERIDPKKHKWYGPKMPITVVVDDLEAIVDSVERQKRIEASVTENIAPLTQAVCVLHTDEFDVYAVGWSRGGFILGDLVDPVGNVLSENLLLADFVECNRSLRGMLDLEIVRRLNWCRPNVVVHHTNDSGEQSPLIVELEDLDAIENLVEQHRRKEASSRENISPFIEPVRLMRADKRTMYAVGWSRYSMLIAMVDDDGTVYQNNWPLITYATHAPWYLNLIDPDVYNDLNVNRPTIVLRTPDHPNPLGDY